MQRSISCGPRNGLGLCNERGYDSAAPLRGGPPLILLLCLTLLAAPAFAQGTLSASDATALSELASFANAELERGTRAEDPAAARNAAENKAHIDRMVGAARANDAALRAKGIVTEVAVAGRDVTPDLAHDPVGEVASGSSLPGAGGAPTPFCPTGFVWCDGAGIDHVGQNLGRAPGRPIRMARRVVP